MADILINGKTPDTYFNKGAELVKKIIAGEATREHIKSFVSHISFDLHLGKMTNVLEKYVLLKNLGTLLRSIEKELQDVATDEALAKEKSELANILGAKVTVRSSKVEYEFTDERWLKLQRQINEKEILIQEAKADLENLKAECDILAKILLSEGKEGKLLDEKKDVISVILK